MIKLVLLNTQQNFFEIQNRFAGWYDVGLTQQGIEDSKQIANILKQNDIKIDCAFMSVLLRAEQTYQTVAKELGYKIRSFKSWKLNDRHLGALQGLNAIQAQNLFGRDITKKLLIDKDFLPPKLTENGFQNPNNDELYSGLKESMPLAENYNQMAARVVNYVCYFILKILKVDQTALIVGHAETLNAILSTLTNNKHTMPNQKNKVVILELSNSLDFVNCYQI